MVCVGRSTTTATAEIVARSRPSVSCPDGEGGFLREALCSFGTSLRRFQRRSLPFCQLVLLLLLDGGVGASYFQTCHYFLSLRDRLSSISIVIVHSHPPPPLLFSLYTVQQSVSVNTNINNNVNQQYPQYCTDDSTLPWVKEDNTDCAPHFVHGAGAYKDDATYMDSPQYTEDPFFSPLLAHHCEGNTCTFASWGTHAHVPTPFISPIIYINRYRNCEGGTLEHTQIIHK